MAKTNNPVFAFNRGEVSKEALGRVDIEKLRFAASCQVNWQPFVVGPMMVRPGTAYIGGINNNLPCRMIPFVFSRLDTAMIELTDSTARIWVNETPISRVSVSTAITHGDMSSSSGWDTTGTTAGNTVTISGGVMTLSCPAIGGLAQASQTVTVSSTDQTKEHGLRITVTNGPITVRVGTAPGIDDLVQQTDLDTGTHSLAFTPMATAFTVQIESTVPRQVALTGCQIDSAGILTLPTPWTAIDLANVRFEQSGDIVYIACRNIRQHKIERRSTNGWSVTSYYSEDGPFNNTPGRDNTKFTPSGCYGNITLTSDKSYFEPHHVGCLFRLFAPGQDFTVVVGAGDAWTPVFEVDGVSGDRNFQLTISGTWTGTIRLQRSTVSADTGWVDIAGATKTANGTISDQTAGTRFDNTTVWYRCGFKGNDYISGSATISNSLTSGGNYGIVRVTGFIDKKTVQCEVLRTLTSLTSTTNWQEGQWSDVSGWPTSVRFHEGRLGWFGQDKMWLSESGNYTGFSEINLATGADAGDSGPIIEQFGYGPVDVVSWGLSLTRLLLGREQAIASARSNTLDEPMTPTNVSIKDCSTQGAARMDAVKIGKRGVFVQQSGRRVYDLSFNAQEFDYTDRDLTRLNLDIGAAGFVDIAYQRQPDTYVHIVRGDGQVALLTYDPADEVEGWSRFQTLGVVENVCVLPANDIEDYVYYVVRRRINHATVRYLERVARRNDCVGGTLNNMADAYVSWTGSASTTMSGLSHLEGESVVVWADGAPIGSATVSSGSITFPDGQSHTNAVAGLGGFTTSATGTDISQITGLATKYSGYPALMFADCGDDGKLRYMGTVNVSSTGTLTLPNNRTASKIVAVLGYCAVFESAKLAYAAQGGTALTQRKKVNHLGIVGYDAHSQGVQFGSDLGNLDNLPLVEADATTTTNKIWDQYDRPLINFPGEWDTDSRLVLFGQAPYPAKIGGVVISVTTNDKL